MKDKKFMYFLALGGFELSLILFFSLLSVALSLLGGDSSSFLFKIKLLVIVFSISISIWGFFNRRKARCFLTASGSRMVLFLITTILLQDYNLYEDSRLSRCFLVITFFEALFITSIFFYNFNFKWDEILKIWENIRKVSVKKERFYIGNLGTPLTEGKMHRFEKIILPVCIPGILLLLYLASYFKFNFKDIMLRVSVLAFVFIMSMATGSALASLVNLIRIEKQKGIKFLTEFADAEEIQNIGNKKIRKCK